MKTTDPKKRALLDSLKDGLIVSCQVQKDDPIYTDDIVVKMAEAAKWAGAVGIRANSPEQIKAIKDKVDLPMIGLWKIWHDDTDVFITPTMDAARAVWETERISLRRRCMDIQRKLSISRVRITACLRKCAVPSARMHSS